MIDHKEKSPCFITNNFGVNQCDSFFLIYNSVSDRYRNILTPPVGRKNFSNSELDFSLSDSTVLYNIHTVLVTLFFSFSEDLHVFLFVQRSVKISENTSCFTVA